MCAALPAPPGCFEGTPVYARTGGPEDEPRTLWHNDNYGDWEFAAIDGPNEDQIVMYGDPGKVSPMDVKRWHMAAALSTPEAKLMAAPDDDVYFVAQGVTIRCDPSSSVSAHVLTVPSNKGKEGLQQERRKKQRHDEL